MSAPGASKPLTGVRVLDFSALGPGPFASMMLADFGADVLSIRRPGGLSIDPGAWPEAKM
jgi:alpha-methylacyl-CoA racemase